MKATMTAISILIASALALAAPKPMPSATLDAKSPSQGPSNVNITVYLNSNCKNDNFAFTNIVYWSPNTWSDSGNGFRSYRINGRDLRSDEVLDFSTTDEAAANGPNGHPNIDEHFFPQGGSGPAQQCGHWIYQAGNNHKTKGCHNIPMDVQCLNVWHH